MSQQNQANEFEFAVNVLDEILSGYNQTVMVDIETLSTEKRAAVWSIATVSFEVDAIRGAKFVPKLNTQCYIHPDVILGGKGRKYFAIDQDTIDWLDVNNTTDWPIWKEFFEDWLDIMASEDEDVEQRKEQATARFLQSVYELFTANDTPLEHETQIAVIQSFNDILAVFGVDVSDLEQANEKRRVFRKQQVLMSKGKDFDFPILENLMKVFDEKCPWHYRNTHDVRAYIHQLNRSVTVLSRFRMNIGDLKLNEFVEIVDELLVAGHKLLTHEEVPHVANVDCHKQIELLNGCISIHESITTLLIQMTHFIEEHKVELSDEPDEQLDDIEDAQVSETVVVN